MSSSSQSFTRSAKKSRATAAEDIFDQEINSVEIEDFECEESLVVRIKLQREKIEQLTEMYAEKEDQLDKQRNQNEQLKEEVEHLVEISLFKQKYEGLKLEYESLFKQNQMNKSEIDELKGELDDIVKDSTESINQLRGEIRLLREKNEYTEAALEDKEAERDEQVTKIVNAAEKKVYKLQQEILALGKNVEDLKAQIAAKCQEEAESREFFNEEIKVREADCLNLEKLLENVKKENSQLKDELDSALNALEKKSTDFDELGEQVKVQLKNCKKEIKEKNALVYELRDALTKADGHISELENTVETVKSTHKRYKDVAEVNYNKLAQEYSEEKCRLDVFIEELKESVEKQFEAKISTQNENKRLKATIERKEQQDRTRKTILRNECKEVQKLEDIMNRLA